jgi:negative regulator of sigma E activity
MPNQEHNYYEKLSALTDGEPVDGTPNGSATAEQIDQLLDQLTQDERGMQAWQAFHLTRDVMQKDYHSALSTDFCARVSACLDDEMTYSADDPAEYDSAFARDDKVVPLQRPAVDNNRVQSAGEVADISALARSNRRWKSVAAFGMAATVALASFGALQFFGTGLNSTDGPSLAGGGSTGPEIARLAPGSSTAQPVALSGSVVPAVLTGGGTHWRDGGQQGHAIKVEQQLNSYLTNHLEDAAMGKVQGMISHTRVVGYDTSVLRSEAF